MAGSIKGITVEFNGDTTKLQKALRQMNQEARKTDKELKDINRALKFNPGNTTLLAQKQQVLGEKIQQTRAKLVALRDAQRRFNETPGADKQSAEYRQLEREIIVAESQLKHFNRELQRVKYEHITQMGEAFKTAGQKARTAGMYVSAAAAASIVAGKKLLELANAQNQAEAQLTEVYKSRQKATTAQTQATLKLASAIQKEGVYGDEVILAGAKQLATYTRTTAAVDKLLPSLANLLAQNKGVSASQEDAAAMANLFGKALMGQTGALKRAGISFTAAQEEVLKYGTEEEKVAMLAEVVHDNVGDMNKALAETDAGKLQQAKNTIGDFGERLGNVLLPHLANLAKWLGEKVLPGVEKIITFIESHPIIAKTIIAITALITVLGPLLIIFGSLASVIGSVMTMAPALAAAFAALTGPIGIVAAAIAGCIAAITLLWKHSDTFRKSVKAAWAQIGAAVNDAVKAIKAAMKSAGVSGNDLKKAFSAIAKFITEIWGSKLGAIIQRVATTIAATIRALASTISAISALMSGDWKKFASNMASATKAMATGIVNAFVPVNKIKQLAQTAANGVKTVFSSMSSSIRSTIASAVNAAGSTWNGIKSKLTTPLNNAYSTVKSALNKIKHLFPMTIGKVFTGLKLPHFKVSGGKAPFGVGGKGSLPKWSVSWYKKGGIFDGPSIIGVGEAGPEAVIPIDRLQDMLNKMADSIVNGIAMNNMLQGAAAGGEVVIKNYLFENGPQLGETVVKTYDQYKKIIG